jgi:hypothetical protein
MTFAVFIFVTELASIVPRRKPFARKGNDVPLRDLRFPGANSLRALPSWQN